MNGRKETMKILYDYQAVYDQKYGGISRYFYEVISRIKNDKKYKIVMPVVFSQNYYFRSLKAVEFNVNKGEKLIYRMINEMYTIIFLLIAKVKKDIDILHPTYYKALYLIYFPWLKPKNGKIVITVHDMIHEIYPKGNEGFIKRKKKVLDMADGIITVSEKTKIDLLKFYPELAKKNIKVIYHGNSVVNTEKNLDNSFILPSRYILFVGQRNAYKNFEIVIKAFSKLRKEDLSLHLVCAGGGDFSEHENKLFQEYAIESCCIQHSVNDDLLSYMYQNAIVFVFPSLYEGFGIPILEAFANGCPIVLSNASCFPEIAGDAALYFDGEDSCDLYFKLKSVIYNDACRYELIEKGKECLKKYSWEKAAAETMDFYETLSFSDKI